MHLFEYAVLRIVPRVEREEFLNVGVIVYCASQGFLECRYCVPEARLRAFTHCELDVDDLTERLRSFERICQGRRHGGPIGQLPVASRFRWLTATRSTLVQTSPVHPGLCEDPAATLARLYAQLVE
ncbi:DUF3037 domain-containing protein [Hymenobacter lutimineralis]|uniref:DUF3037 domain-containing protein n=1 Tax=Hymenobacter lutimineralis TaxID=2606448 RepID=A0A5D6V518_9BACT|nr:MULTISPECIES: DUF3037 domain-containing protein [Hymenobacter]QIX62242.1 DUF3037 domain-containing protein [Hymenobacter sp. BT18]TYZ10038.1 DUF3037 domain-containing protein [Hymenobacter lutimineralis]